MTLLEGKTRILELLARGPSDDTIPAARLVAAFNRARRNGWREIAGRNAAQTVQYDLTADDSTYTLTTVSATFGGLVSVSIRAEAGDTPVPITEASLRWLIDRFPAFPEYDSSTDTSPLYWYVTPSATPVLVLWPPPSATVANGLVLQVVGKAAALSSDSDESALPSEVDEWACHRAAIDLAPYLRDEPQMAVWLNELRNLEREAWRYAKRQMRGFSDGLRSIAPSSEHAFGDRSLTGEATATAMEGNAPLATGVYLTQTDWTTATGGETSVVLDVTASPVASGHEAGVVVKSAWRGELTGTVTVAVDGATITAQTGTDPDTSAQIELLAGEPYRAIYMAQVTS